MKQRTSIERRLATAAVAAIACTLSACQSETPAPVRQQAVGARNEKVTPRYAGWTTYSYEQIRIHHPPQHPVTGGMAGMAKGYTVALRRIAALMGMPPFDDTLVVYYYTGFGQGREMTGQEYPFAEPEVIHFWQPSFPGPTLMQFLLPRWSAKGTKHLFLYHGLIALNDYSGQDYHRAVMQLVDSGGFIPLAELAVDTTVNSNTERLQTAEGASFAAYLIGQYTVEILRQLYESDEPFQLAAERLLGKQLDEIQAEWLGYAQVQQRPATTSPTPTP